MSTNSRAFWRSSAVRITVVVVPSLDCRSWALHLEINIFAVGCSTPPFSRTVTPSLVTIVSPPPPSNHILSSPLGPSVLLTASARALAAATLFRKAVRPWVRSVSRNSDSCSCVTIRLSERQGCLKTNGLLRMVKKNIFFYFFQIFSYVSQYREQGFIYGQLLGLYNLGLISG